jgi:multiple sugar transport system substrate-binding protein
MKNRLIVLTILLALLLTGTITRAQSPVTLRMSTWAGVDEAKELQAILDKINASQTEYKIVHEPIPSDYYTQIQTQLAGGTAADLLWIDQDHMSLAAEGVFLPLTDCLKNAPAKSAADVKDYYPDIMATSMQKDVVYGLPWISQPVVVYYNKDLFKAANLAEPTADWTWDDFMKDAKALTKKGSDGKATQWGFTANGWPPPQMFIWQAGGDIISDDLKTAPIDSPEAVEGMEFYLKLAYNPELSPTADILKEQGFNEMFKAGKVAMFMGGAADDLDRVPNLNVGVVSTPKHPKTGKNTTFAWSADTVIAASTKNPELACKALLAVTEGIQNWKIVSPRVSQATTEHLLASEPRKKANADPIMKAVPSMRAFKIIPQYAKFTDVLWNKYFNPLINHETDKSVKDLAAEVRPALEALLPEAK